MKFCQKETGWNGGENIGADAPIGMYSWENYISDCWRIFVIYVICTHVTLFDGWFSPFTLILLRNMLAFVLSLWHIYLGKVVQKLTFILGVMREFCQSGINPFPNKPWILRVCSASLENTVGKGEIAHNEQFLLFPQCFLPIWRTLCHFHQIWNCRLQTRSIWKH